MVFYLAGLQGIEYSVYEAAKIDGANGWKTFWHTALPGVIAAQTTLPVIGVPIKGMLDGLDALLSIVQMPPGIPVATVGVNGAQNAAVLACQMLALSDEALAQRMRRHKEALAEKIVRANQELAEVKYKYKVEPEEVQHGL